MKKVVDFLEKYVEWVAVGLGVLFVAAMAWLYLVSSPVTVTVAGRQLGPGDIDKYIAESPIATLESQMHGGGTLNLNQPSWLTQFKNAMSLADHKPVVLSRPWIDTQALPVGNRDPKDP